MNKTPRVLGILGGLGPMASVYFYELLTKHTKAARDQDHICLLYTSEWRTFKLCRMLGARMLEQGFEPGAHGAPPPLCSGEEPPCMLQMELVFLPGAAHRVYDLFCPCLLYTSRCV